MVDRTRRRLLAAAAATATALAGCAGDGDDAAAKDPTTRQTATPTAADGTDDAPTPTATGGEEPTATETAVAVEKVPVAAERRHLGHPLEELNRGLVSGGPPKDGIPSIDEPRFTGVDAADGRLDERSRVIGLVVDGDARVYSKRILVHHEIVNDVVGGVPVALTYCPLTGTALAFRRGETTFGTTGRLVNSNLVMYDRATDTWWPQVAATGISGPLRGEGLQELPVAWTTWGRWKRAYPESRVLSERTGYIRPYGNDPYPSDYYERGGPLFEPIHRDDRLGPKLEVLGARGRSDATAVTKPLLADRGVLQTTVDGEPAVFVHDAPLATGHAYRKPPDRTVEATPAGIRVDGTVHEPGDLPLPAIPSFEAMWFAWVAFYPDTRLHA